ncbi:GGDEF domain-containing protein [Paractinoplanes rishiriensis]|uniref:GGDEF domain-containing protein n=1 Tax=Paractinoplanes rishiriensis TaxID=1050105 RepID=A0A919JVB7_9ACTN|nr:GGDEF domain-containing protein [Actinoplanes rishiriensis]GIE93934.1 hypothetical protein Ari01nite_13990 [Actinoplanes rishiriensis]
METRVGHPSGVHQPRRRMIRANAVCRVVPAVLGAGYAVGTWGAEHRGLMLLVAGVMAITAVLAYAAAPRLSQSRCWMGIQLVGAGVSLSGSALLGVLDGAVHGPLGALVPLTVVFLAIVLPPRAFLTMATYAMATYAIVVVFSEPSPDGYPMVHALGFGGAAALCLRHAMVLASLRRRLADTSRTDPLTGCLNRRGFDELVAAELSEAERSGSRASLVLLDLDHFKDVNDSHGHRAGDELLAWAGHVLRTEVSVHGGVARIGGDEFALLLTDTDADAAGVVVDRLREQLRPCAPASLGFATYPQDARDATALAGVADRRLYADKAARDRRAPCADAVAQARTRIGQLGPAATVSTRERRRHSIADPGWMSMAQTCVALLYVLLFTAGHPYRVGMVAICGWGFVSGLAVVLGADWLSRSRLARPIMLAFAVSSFLSCASIAVLDGGVHGPLGVGMLLSIPLLMLGMRPNVAAPVAGVAAVFYLGVAVFVGEPGFWYVAINVLGTAAASVACAVQGRAAARQRRLLTRLSRVDVLTDALNRRGFAERFAGQLDLARRHGTGAALLVLDLDGFKQLNDTAGHAAGDELLRWVAGTLRGNLQAHDIVGRLGGDEFVVLVEADGAEDTADRLQRALAERTGASFGVALLGLDGDDFDGLYAAADARLYRQKVERRGGRSRELSAPA